ncbi:MAG: hypothetical protein IJX77_08100 [Ruminococcus sp.]|nr:hypothetical protein [Ruminococcus sp.]
MKILFVLLFLLFIADVIFISLEFRKNNTTQNGKKLRPSEMICGTITLILLIAGIGDLTGLIQDSDYSGTFGLMGISAAAAFLLLLISRRTGGSKTAGFAAKAVAVAAILELTLFNVPSYRVFFGGYEEKTVFPSGAYIDDTGAYVDKDGVAVNPDRGGIHLEYKDIDIPVRTIYADVKFSSENAVASMAVDVKDEARQGGYRSDIAQQIISAKKDYSRYTTLDVSGNVSDIKVKIAINTDADNESTVDVYSITFNKMIPFEIFYVRYLFIALISVFVYAVVKGSYFNRSYRQNELFCKAATLLIAAAACVTAFSGVNYKRGDMSWKELIETDEGNQMSLELVEAFEKGNVYLDAVPNDELLSLKDPYDRWTRDIVSYYEWDHVLWEGKYYSYYGIAPVVLLFMPFHKLTGNYCPDEIAVLLFSVIGFIGLAFLMMRIVKKWFADIPSGFYLSAVIILFINCGVWHSLARTDFYEVATSAGFAFLTWGAYFLISANIIGKGIISLPRALFASLFMAIAVLCRPTLVLYCICGALFMLMALKRSSVRDCKQEQKWFNSRSIRYIVCAFLPMAAIGLIQMWYNYARFGSPFEFGIQYSLTINNFTKTEFHPNLSWIAVYNYLFNPPVYTADHPFISTNFQDMGVNGFFFLDETTMVTSGLFWLVPPMIAYFFSGKALKRLPDRKTKLSSAIYIALPCVIVPFGIIAAVWESGYTSRYISDFAWQAILGAFAICFFMYSNMKNDTLRKGMKLFFSISLVWTSVVSSVQIFNHFFRYSAYHWDYPEMAAFLTKLFNFWR